MLTACTVSFRRTAASANYLVYKVQTWAPCIKYGGHAEAMRGEFGNDRFHSHMILQLK